MKHLNSFENKPTTGSENPDAVTMKDFHIKSIHKNPFLIPYRLIDFDLLISLPNTTVARKCIYIYTYIKTLQCLLRLNFQGIFPWKSKSFRAFTSNFSFSFLSTSGLFGEFFEVILLWVNFFQAVSQWNSSNIRKRHRGIQWFSNTEQN